MQMKEATLANRRIDVSCCIAGGGPAGMMLGLLLARAGVETLVLEKHKDFLRDFRGDTIHPSTLELMYELGLLDDFLKQPHQEVRQLIGQVGNDTVMVADFSHLPTVCKFIAFMPQWHFLNFIAEHAAAYPTFHLRMQAEVTGLSVDAGRIVGVKVVTAEGPIEVRASLTVGADGRHSVIREQAGLEVEVLGAPIDVLWFRISRQADDPPQPLGRFVSGKIMVMLNRDEYWQCGYVIPKGGFIDVQQRGLAPFQKDISGIAPFLGERVGELQSWDQIKLLTVAVDRLRRWYRPGLLCIGDAAHAMSPIGGVGINLAIQDAVAAANLLAAPLSEKRLTTDVLEKVQRRRQLPTRIIQSGQVFLQNRVISRVLGSNQQPPLPLLFRLLRSWPFLRRIPARLIGVGFRPEHLETKDVYRR
jgi:2-polyprenyl-6-methoxyphenol hydroxylase-like FAD-dependent oxidoreductase